MLQEFLGIRFFQYLAYEEKVKWKSFMVFHDKGDQFFRKGFDWLDWEFFKIYKEATNIKIYRIHHEYGFQK